MKENKVPQILIIVSVILIVLNFIFTSNEMTLAFWLRIATSALLIVAMVAVIHERKKRNKNNAE